MFIDFKLNCEFKYIQTYDLVHTKISTNIVYHGKNKLHSVEMMMMFALY